MKRQAREDIKVSLGDTEYLLRASMAAIQDIEEITGISLLSGDQGVFQELVKAKNLNATLWALLGGHDSEFETPRDVGLLYNLSDVGEITEAIIAELTNGNPVNEELELPVGDEGKSRESSPVA